MREIDRRRMGKELGRPVLKDRPSVRIALAYPNRYEVGMASLGFQTVYRLLNEHPKVRCERVFLREKTASEPLRTFESGESLNRFDLIGFSVSYELDIPNVVRMLMQAGIPPLSHDRNQAHPLVFLGGAIGGLNPSPLLPFIDGLLAGEGEGIFDRLADALHGQRGGHAREQRLDALAELDGMFIPGHHASVVRRIVDCLKPPPAYTPIVTPHSHFANMFVIETARGCPRGCLFCAACKISHPFRLYPVDSILDAVRRFNPGAEKIGLEGAGLSDYPQLIPLCRSILDMNRTVSFSSIRADRVTREFIPILEASRIRSFTVAPEAGNEAMRRRIGKDIPDTVLMETVDLISESRIDVLKLYYLIGLPEETDDDLNALILSVRDVCRRFLGKSRTRRVRLSVNAFVPKPFTEFQWAPMLPEQELNRKRKRIAEAFKKEPRVVQVPKSGREEILQGILSLGDERIGMGFLRSIREGMGFQQAIAGSGVDLNQLLFKEKNIEDSMPWDFIHGGVSKDRLWNRYRKGKA